MSIAEYYLSATVTTFAKQGGGIATQDFVYHEGEAIPSDEENGYYPKAKAYLDPVPLLLHLEQQEDQNIRHEFEGADRVYLALLMFDGNRTLEVASRVFLL